MLADGKVVNYLMIGGEVFAKKLTLPKLYSFGLPQNDRPQYMIKMYSDGTFDFTSTPYDIHLGYYNGLGSTAVVPVFQILEYKGSNYALTCGKNFLHNNGTSTGSIGIYWIKMSDFGDYRPVSPDLGGVNSPSYLPFIYDIWEVAPYVC